MVYLTASDYLQESKKNKVVSPRRGSHGGIATSKKITLPTQYRTQKHMCSKCTRKDAVKYKITTKEVRWLCPLCLLKHNNKNLKEKPNFLPASKLWRKDQKSQQQKANVKKGDHNEQ